MLDKFSYYHGAALTRLLDDERCRAVRKHGLLGYVVNDEIFVFLKYTTKARSPWGFAFDQEDVNRCLTMSGQFKRIVLGLICGGDGVCALEWDQACELLGGRSGRIAVGRKHNHSYEVWCTEGELKRKISLRRWPSLLFESEAVLSDNTVDDKYVGAAI